MIPLCRSLLETLGNDYQVILDDQLALLVRVSEYLLFVRRVFLLQSLLENGVPLLLVEELLMGQSQRRLLS